MNPIIVNAGIELFKRVISKKNLTDSASTKAAAIPVIAGLATAAIAEPSLHSMIVEVLSAVVALVLFLKKDQAK